MNTPAPIDTHSVMFITQRPDVIMVEGKGSWLTDNNGKRYLDFLQGWAVNCLGHGNPGMIAALNAQAKNWSIQALRSTTSLWLAYQIC